MKRAMFLAVFTLIAAGCGGSSSSASSSSPNFNSMIGMRASSLDSEKAGYAYRNAGGYQEMEISYTMWWNASREHCVLASTIEGKVEMVETVPAGDCQ